MPILVTLLAAYLIGSVPFGFIVARLRGVDIFKQGSGNIGATNVGRVLGRRFGALVFVLDFFKGMVPVLLGHWVAEHWPSAPLDEFPAGSLETAAGLAAFLGHLFPIYLRFRGGKGVATGTGVVAVLAPLPMVVAAVAWGLVVLAFRYVSLASIGAALVLVLAQLRLHAAAPSGFVADPRSWFCVLAAVMVVVRHRTNIRRLVEGRENRLKETRFMAAATRIVHLFALCLWFGGTVFFSFIAAPSRLRAVRRGAQPSRQRPALVPVLAAVRQARRGDQGAA
ncbi:MAG: glycerol-3-phosphate 1-O-acyltransferase PlsY [Gemmataceae bacterium]